MAVIKKIDVEKHFAARRAIRLGRSGPLGPAQMKSPLRAAKASVPKHAPAAETSIFADPIPPPSGGNRLLRPLGSRPR